MAWIDTRATCHDHADFGKFLLGDQVGRQGGAENGPLNGCGVNALNNSTETGSRVSKRLSGSVATLASRTKFPAVQQNDVGMGTAYIESNDHSVQPR